MVALVFSMVIISASCSKEEDNNGGGQSSTEFKVEFNVPETVTLDQGATSMDFKVLFKNAPNSSDVIILDGNGKKHTCKITSVTSDVFSIQLPSDLTAGSYDVYIERNGTKKKMGTVTIYFNDGVSPASGSTVYGLVSCDGKGIPNVVVSDGVLVVKTDANGVYQLNSEKANGYVFISIPSGYEVNSNGVLPQFHKYLTQAAKVAERADFQLFSVGDQSNHTMLVFGDMHLASRNGDLGQFQNFIDDVNAVVTEHQGKKIYALSLGDMTWDLYWKSNSYDLNNYITTVSAIHNLQIFHTIGNHDHSMFYAGDWDTVTDFKKIVCPTNYSFNVGKVHYVVLDNILCKNTGEGTSASRIYDSQLAEDALAWLKKDLAFVDKSTPIVVTMHAPEYGDTGSYSMANASTLASILKPYSVAHIFTGHTHKMYNVDKLSSDHIYEHNAGAVCATWWWSGKLTSGVHVAQDGAPGGYSIVDVAGSDFKWQFKATGYPVSYQFRTYDRNQIHFTASTYVPGANDSNKDSFASYAKGWSESSTSNEVYFNIWNYDPSWKIEVTENGKSLNVVKENAYDPLHLMAYTFKRLNSNAAVSFATSNNKHTFKVTASEATSTLEFKVTDRFGNVYTETMKRPKAFNVDNYKL